MTKPTGDGGKRKKTHEERRPLLPGRREFAHSVVDALPRGGLLLFVTLRPPTSYPPRKLHRRFAKFVRGRTDDYMIVLEWGPGPKDGAREQIGVHGEHLHALVRVNDFDRFERDLHAWASERGIHEKARDWEAVSGWVRYRSHGRLAHLRSNMCRTFNYMTKPGAGAARSFSRDGIASGAFQGPWRTFCNETVAARSVSPKRPRCGSCKGSLETTATTRRQFCSDACRVRSHRWKKRGGGRRWILHLRSAS